MLIKKKYKYTSKFILVSTIIILCVIILEAMRFFKPEYGQTLRNYNHLLAGIYIPYMFNETDYKKNFYDFKSNKFMMKFNNTIKFSCFVYLSGCFVWEFGQFICRGYLQIDQYIYDIIGIVIIFLLYKYKECS